MLLGFTRGQPTCAHQELQGTCGAVIDYLKHSRDEEFVQYHLHSPQIVRCNNAKGQRLVGLRQQGQDAR